MAIVEDGIFTTEIEILNHADKISNKLDLDISHLRKEYRYLASNYEKLLKQTQKLINMADYNQKKLIETNEIVEEKVIKLTQAEEKLKKLALTDSLTGLHNRRGINNFLTELITRNKRFGDAFSIIIIDIDHFKRINDSYGHLTGDLVLKEISDTLCTSLRAFDHIARWGGEEFLLALPDTNIEGAKILAEKMREKIENLKMSFNDCQINVTISLGVCGYNPEYGINKCLELADKELYKSKIGGRNMVNSYED